MKTYADVVKGQQIEKNKPYNNDDDKLYAKIKIIFQNDLCFWPDYIHNTDTRSEYKYYDYDVINNIVSEHGNFIVWNDCYHLPKKYRMFDQYKKYITNSKTREHIVNIIYSKPLSDVPKCIKCVDFTIKHINYAD
jgi:hypothetical protein